METIFGKVDWLTLIVLVLAQVISASLIVVYLLWVLVLWVSRKFFPDNPWILHKRIRSRLQWIETLVPPSRKDKYSLLKNLRRWNFLVKSLTAGNFITFIILLILSNNIPQDELAPATYDVKFENTLTAVLFLTYCFAVPIGISGYIISKKWNYTEPRASLAMSAARLIKISKTFEPTLPSIKHQELVREINVFCKNALRCGVKNSNPQIAFIQTFTADGSRNYWRPFWLITQVQYIVSLVYSGYFTGSQPKMAFVSFIAGDQSMERSKHTLPIFIAVIPLVVVLIDATMKILENINLLGN